MRSHRESGEMLWPPALVGFAAVLVSCTSAVDKKEVAPAFDSVGIIAADRGVARDAVLKASAVEVDRRRVAVIGRFEKDGVPYATLIGPSGEAGRRLTAADELMYGGLIDLSSSSALRFTVKLPRSGSAAGIKRPAFLLKTFRKELVAARPEMGIAPARPEGTRSTRTLYIVEYAPRLRVLLKLEVERRSEDGFGGHRIESLALRQEGGKIVLEGTRQDSLPARRARCMRPKPYKVQFELEDGRFRERKTERPASDCY